MTRFNVILGLDVLLAVLLGAFGWWLWRQRGRAVTAGGRVLIFLVSLGCLLLLTFFVGGLQFLWHERRNQPATAEDLRIIEGADTLLKDEASWNRDDDKQCDEDKATRKWSLYCALETACADVVGVCEHAEVASQEVRFAIEEVTQGKHFEGRLMGFNNLPETRFEDIKRVLRIARENVKARLVQP